MDLLMVYVPGALVSGPLVIYFEWTTILRLAYNKTHYHTAFQQTTCILGRGAGTKFKLGGGGGRIPARGVATKF